MNVKENRDNLNREAEILECIALDASSILKASPARSTNLHFFEGRYDRRHRKMQK